MYIFTHYSISMHTWASPLCFPVHSELCQLFNLEDYRENMKNAVLLDLYYYTLQFARDNHFSKEQTSAFFSIVKQTHEMAIGTCRLNVYFGNIGSFN